MRIRSSFRWHLLLLLIPLQGSGQKSRCPASQDKKALSQFEDATSLFKSRKYQDALEKVAKSIDADPEFADAYYLQGTLALKRKDFPLMEESYKKAIELCPETDPEAYYQLGWYCYDLKRWTDAETWLKAFLEMDQIQEDHAKKAELMLLRSKLYAHPVPFDPKPVRSICTADPEYLPYISPDNQFVFFTRRFELKERNMLVPQSVEKFMMARLKEDGTYENGKPMDDPFNRGTSNNEGSAAITIDNRHLYFTVNEKGNFDIYTSDYSDGYWSDIRPVENINDSRQWDSQPTISADGRTLYFASARDSVTGLDIYYSHKSENGKWSRPSKLSDVINTGGNEKSPFMHSDSKTLYFASDSLPGLGGFDLFMVKQDEKGNWKKPVNLGYPINTDADEVSFIVSTDGKRGYFASNKINGNSGFDIYSFELYPEVRPNMVYFQKGELKLSDNEPRPATIEIRDVVTNDLKKIDVDSVTGEYAFVGDFNHDLMLSVKQEGVAFSSQYVSTKDTSNFSPKKKDIQLSTLEVGGQYTINDILFDYNSDRINDTIKVVLNEFAEYLMINPKLRLSLQGHTDDIGSAESNMTLSTSRAKTVYDYLVSRGIEKNRLAYQGLGETKPIASNATEEGRAKNRRTVFVVTQK